MGAPIGNQYNRVWNRESALKLFRDSLSMLIQDQQDYDNSELEKPRYKINTLETLAVKQGVYVQIYDYLIKQFGSDCEDDFMKEGDSESDLFAKEFSSIKKGIGTILISRLSEQGLHRQVETIMTIFLLKTNHNKVESTKVDLTSSDGTIRAPQMSKEEVKGIFKEVLGDI